MSIIKEFREFAVKGNMVDMAVGIIIGGAFGKIVTSLVNDLIMPVLGVIISSVNFSDLSIVLKDPMGDSPAVLLKYGAFLQSLFDFTIIAFSIFIMIKILNKVRANEAASKNAAPPAPSAEEKLLTEIRDLLSKK